MTPTPTDPTRPIWTRPWVWVAFFLLPLYPFAKHGWMEVWDYAGFDYSIFYQAATDLEMGKSPYSETVFHSETEPDPLEVSSVYIYPAFFARLLVPLTGFEPNASRRMFVLLCYLALLVLLFPEIQTWKKPSDSGAENLLRFFAVVCLFLNWGPMIQNLRFGQSNLLALVFFCGAWRCATHLKSSESAAEFFAGGLIGLAAMIKLTPFLILPFLAIGGYWKSILGVAAGTLLAVLISGWSETREFFFEVLPIVGRLEDSPEGIALGTILDRHLPGSPGPWILAILYLCLLAWAYRERAKLKLQGLILLGALLPTVFAGLWYHHYLLALLPLLILVPKWLTGCLRRYREGRKKSAVLRAVALAVPLSLGFYYWFPIRIILTGLAGFLPLSELEIFVVGHVAVFAIFLPSLIGADERESRTE